MTLEGLASSGNYDGTYVGLRAYTRFKDIAQITHNQVEKDMDSGVALGFRVGTTDSA